MRYFWTLTNRQAAILDALAIIVMLVLAICNPDVMQQVADGLRPR